MDYKQQAEALRQQGLSPKYEHPGIYSISIGDKLVYIGKSTNMLERLAAHIDNTQNNRDKSNKYDVFREAIKRGMNIQFDVLYDAKTADKDEIGFKEAELINQYLPPLNYQLPLLDNYHRFKTNKKAQTITLDEILGIELFRF